MNKDWTFTTVLKKANGRFIPGKHITSDDLFEMVMDYYEGRVLKDEMRAIFIRAGFAEKTVEYRILDRSGGYVVTQQRRWIRLKPYTLHLQRRANQFSAA